MFKTIYERLVQLVLYSETTPIRFFLAMVSTGWCFVILLPGNTFDRPVYSVMAQVVGQCAEFKWFVVWGLLSASMWWRVFSDRPYPKMSIFINYFCLVVYTITAGSIVIAKPYPFPAGLVALICCAVASFWVLIRTHINCEEGWRID